MKLPFKFDAQSWNRLKTLFLESGKAWLAQRASSKGAALAFYMLFSMAPMLLIVIAVAGAVFGHDAAQGAIFGELKGMLGGEGAKAIQDMLISASRDQNGGFAAVIAGVLLLVGATSVFAELKDSLDEMWEVPPSTESGFVALLKTRFMSFGLVMVLALLLMVSLVVSAALAAVAKLWGGMALLAVPISFLFSFAVTTCLFAAIYKILPQVKLSYSDVFTGAAGTAALFMLGKFLIGLYLSKSDVVSSFGAAGSLIAVLLWIYYSSQIFFFGAEFTHQYATRFGTRCDRPASAEPHRNRFLPEGA
jgi:membrane protein